MTRFLRYSLLALLLCATAHAEDPAEDPAEVHEFIRDRAAGAAAVLAAVKSNDKARLEALAKLDDPDPWDIADALLVQGEAAAAMAFAKAAPRPDTTRLAAHVESRIGQPIHSELRALIDRSYRPLSPAEAKQIITKLDELAAEGGVFERVLAERMRGTLLGAIKEHAEASEAMLAAAGLAERLGWLAAAAGTLGTSGHRARFDQNYDGMLTAWKRLILIQRGRDKPERVAGVQGNVGMTYRDLGDYEGALGYLRDAEEIYRRLGNDEGVAWILTARAGVCKLQGRYQAALVAAEQALELARRGDNKTRLGFALSTLGILAKALGDLDTAERRLREALAIFTDLKDLGSAANCYGNLAGVLLRRGRSEEALRYYDEVLRVSKGLKSKSRQGAALSGKGWALITLGRFDEAEPLLQEAVELARSISDDSLTCNALENLAEVYVGKKSYALARPLLEKAIDLATRLGAADYLVQGYEILARLWLAQAKHGRAFRAAERAMEHARSSMAGLSQTRAAMARGRLTNVYKVALEAAVAWKRPQAVFKAMESSRAIALLEVLENRDAIRQASVPQALREREDDAKRGARAALLRYRAALGSEDLRAVRKRRQELERAEETVRAAVARIQLAQKSASSLLYPEAVTLEEAQALLSRDEVYVLYSLLGKHATALVVNPTGARVVDLGPGAAIQAAARLPIHDPAEDADANLKKQRAALIEPLALEKTVTHVHVSPDGVLSYVPFGALLPNRSVAYMPSATAYQVLEDERGKTGQGVLALGDPDYSGAKSRWKALPATREEARTVGDVVLLGKQATPQGFLDAVKKRPRWRAIHLACHGLVDAEHPMQSALALSFEKDGTNLLTSADVFEHKLPADLAVLSACETGRGTIYRSEGIVGLTQAFVFAGAPRVIVSLWKVDDEATRALMIEFYRLWNPRAKPGDPELVEGSDRKGLGAAAALKKAQAFVRDHPDQPKWRHPYYWAAWVLWGLD